MGKKDKQRHRHNPAKQQTIEPSSSPDQAPAGEPTSASPIEQMFEAKNYQGVIDALRPVVNENSPDIDRRMLARALWMSDGWADEAIRREILAVSMAIQEKDFSDYRRMGTCYLEGGEYDDAIRSYQLSTECKPDAWTYYLLSIALGRGLERYQMDSETQRPAVKAALQKATEFDDCPAEAFLNLEDLEDYGDGGEKKFALLTRAVELHPDHPLTRLTLASRYVSPRKNYAAALDVLAPLLEQKDVQPAVLWLAFVCYWPDQREKVMEILARVRPDEHFVSDQDRTDFDFIRGMVYFLYGDLPAALALIKPFLDSCGRPGPDDVLEPGVLEISWQARSYLLGAIVCAAIYTAQQDEARGIDYAEQFSSIWTESAFPLHRILGSEANTFYNATICYDYSFFNHNAQNGDHTQCTWIEFGPVYQKAAQMLQEHLPNYLNENPEVNGWIHLCQISMRSPEEEEDISGEMAARLQETSNQLPVPAADHHLGRALMANQKYFEGVSYHLRYAIWFGEAYEEITENDYSLTSVCQLYTHYRRTKKGFIRDKYRISDPAQAKKIHAWIFARLEGNKERNNASKVFVRFYTPFWRDLLFDNKMWAELCQAVEALLEFEPADESLIFDYAYGLAEIGQVETSIAVYRRLVSINPKQYSALRNLAIGLLNAGELDEALTMANRALGLKPEDKRAADLVETVKNAMEQAKQRTQPPRGKTTHHKAERSHPETLPPGRAAKTIFDSPNEKLFYHALVSLFPNYLVFPNMASSAIFDYDAMKGLLNEGQVFEYFLKSRVDFCVVSAINYMPLVAFEVDSSYHDTERMSQKDSQKDLIFHQCGVPLVRYRFTHEVDVDELKTEILRALKDAGVDLSKL